MRWRERQKVKVIIRVVIVGAFLFGAYIYFMKNSIDAFVTRLIQLPLIYQMVESGVYWIIVLVIGFGIWKLTDYIRIR